MVAVVVSAICPLMSQPNDQCERADEALHGMVLEVLEETLPSSHQDTPQEEEPTMAQKLHTTPLNQHRNREIVQKPETARKGPKKPTRRKTAPTR